MQLAQHRLLNEHDAFDLAPKQHLNRTVTGLHRIYHLVQHRAQEQERERLARERQRIQARSTTWSARELASSTSSSYEDAANLPATNHPKMTYKHHTNEALLLTQALLLHQRRTLLLTGLLRLVNTAIQAFPAILVARLLRLIEAGTSQPAQKAITATLALMIVLTLKMLTENTFFHQVVQCSTQVRGALAGLIFDKSLRLPPGGGDGVAKLRETKEISTDDKNNNQYYNTNFDDVSSSAALGVGGVLNLMQSDASLIESAALQFHTLWDGPLQIIIYTTLLFRYLGPSVVWGIAVLLLTIPINSITLRILNHLSRYENEAKDARTKRTSESISNMKLLKLQGWEGRFADDIRASRAEEMRRHVARGVVRALNSAISNAVPAVVLVVTLTAYMKTGQPIVASTIFTAISLFNQLRFPLFFYPMLIDSLANGRNAMRRIAAYLSTEEIVPYVKHLPIVGDTGGSIEMTHGNFLWSTSSGRSMPASQQMSLSSISSSSSSSSSSDINISANRTAIKETAPALLDVSLKVNPGEIVAVVGGVGSGKTALIKGLLGELNPVPKTIVELATGNNNAISATSYDEADENSIQSFVSNETGDVAFHPSVVTTGYVAYCSQEAWLPKGTIREAVLFGREYDEKRYFQAIYDAGLDNDIMDFDKSSPLKGALSHDTDVGEGGSALSGGQRARVALARALYADTDTTKIFLLDDCLAALDANVGSTVFERLANRLRATKSAAVLVTNDPSIPRRCDRVVLMGKVPSSASCSRIVDVGTYDELLARGHDLRRNRASMEADKVEEIIMSSDSEGFHHQGAPDSQYLETTGSRSKRRNIHLVGGYESRGNSSDLSCHADPDCQVDMENRPDLLAEHVLPISAGPMDTEDIFSDEYKLSNGTVSLVTVQAQRAAANINEATEQDDASTKAVSSADDAMAAGAVPLSTYVSYFKAVRSPTLVMSMITLYLLVNGALFFQQITVARWTELGHGGAMATALGAKYMASLVNAAILVSIFLWLRSFLTMKAGVRASEFLHSRMLRSVFRAPMSFFDSTPSGQLLSRFGKEIETVDRAVPESIGSVLYCFLQIIASIAGLAGVVTPGMLVPLALVGVLYVKAMALFRPAARDLKRAETRTRSPIYTHFGEALRGVETIRSVPGAMKTWSSKHRLLSNTNLAVFHTVKALDRWLSIRLETLGNAVVLSASLASIFLTRTGVMKAGSAGWGITQSLSITGLMAWAVRCLTDLETNMMSVLRVTELTDIESEEVDLEDAHASEQRERQTELKLAGQQSQPLLQNGSLPNSAFSFNESLSLRESGWPWQGLVQFKNVSMRYSPSGPLVLNRVTLTVPAGTTLGVVGRTGSGKSSLLLTLFRIVEVEKGGRIEIDGIDISCVRLDDLRRSLAIIPQDPVLFAGSVAYNLDATGQSSGEDMWAALEAASPALAQQFRDAEGLGTPISEGGKNLSLGQRQLMCLARALLRKSRLLVLDEATSSVDSKTDQEVQDSIRREFVEKGATVITVAHRLDTVLGYDKIAVLGNGEVLEYGTPSDLLKNPAGELRSLVNADRRNKKKGSRKAQESAVAI